MAVDLDRKAFAFLSGYRRRLADGEATRVELMDAETAATITEAQAIKLRTEFDDTAAKRAAEQQQIDLVSKIIDDGVKLDPKNDDDRMAVNRHFDAVLHQLFPKGPASPGFGQGLIGYTKITGIVPENAFCRYGGRAMAGDDPAQRIDAARTIDTIIDLDPGAGNCLPPRLPGCARRVTDLVRLGFPADKAVQCLDDVDPGFGVEPLGFVRPDDDAEVRLRSASADGGGGGASGEGGGETAALPGGEKAAPASPEAGDGEGEDISAPGDDAEDEDFEPGDEPPVGAEEDDLLGARPRIGIVGGRWGDLKRS